MERAPVCVGWPCDPALIEMHDIKLRTVISILVSWNWRAMRLHFGMLVRHFPERTKSTYGRASPALRLNH